MSRIRLIEAQAGNRDGHRDENNKEGAGDRARRFALPEFQLLDPSFQLGGVDVFKGLQIVAVASDAFERISAHNFAAIRAKDDIQVKPPNASQFSFK